MEGIYVAAVTCYDAEGKINPEAQEKLIERNLKEGARGFFVGGSSGECFLLTREERVRCFEIAKEFQGEGDLIAHVGALSTEEAIYYAKKAKEIGYDKIAATPPFYFGYSQEAVAQYFKDISEAVDMPVFFYNIPGNTHFNIDIHNKSMIELFKSGAIQGIKHTNLDVYQMERIHAINPDLELFGGFEQNMVAFLALGAKSFIGSTFNFMTPHYKKIYDLALSGNAEEALQYQHSANDIMDVICAEGLFPSIKYILKTQGNDAGLVRPPFLPLNDEQKKRVDQVIAEKLYLGE